MIYISVHCHNCGARYDVFGDDLEAGRCGVCPNCLARMPQNACGKLINALLTMEEVNNDFQKANAEYGNPFFTVEIRNQHRKINM